MCIWNLTPQLETLRSESRHLYSLHVHYNLLNHLKFSFHPNSKSVFARLGRALRVFFLPMSGYGWTISSTSLLLLLLLLLKGECTSRVSERSLKLPPSESESFTISLIISFPINIFREVFSELTLSPGFSMLLVVRKTSPYYCDDIDM